MPARSRPPPIGVGCWLLGVAVGCGRPGIDDPCVGADELSDPVGDVSVSGFAAGEWWASESHPFQVDNPDTIWFECPRTIAHKLDRQPDLMITAPGGDVATSIDVDPSVTFQTILGTGISMEAASVQNIMALSPAKRLKLLTRMFDPVHGMGLDLVRVTIGTSDFTGAPWYTYDDLSAAQQVPDLQEFSIQPDVDLGIIGVLQQILAVNPSVTFFASPWSPPAWMKTSDRIAGGSLRSEQIPVYARYLRRFVEAYRANGIPVAALTLQNEPRSQSGDMPTCELTAEQEAALVKALKAELKAGGLDTKAWVFDHNFDAAVDYTGDIFRDADALAATDGIAFHDYAGDPTAMTAVHNKYPDKDILFTEKTLWGVSGVDRAAQYFRNWSRSYVSWVTMLDQDGEPNRGPNSEKPRRFMRSLTYAGDDYYATPEHYLFGLYSRFVQAGAHRIASGAGSASTVTDVAFLNPDATIVVVVINQTDQPQAFALRSEGNQISTVLDAKTAASYVWHSGLGPSTMPPVGAEHTYSARKPDLLRFHRRWVLWAIAAFVVLIDLVTLRRLWASPIFERPQKIAQTILLWVVPGSFLAVCYVLREQRIRRSVDPTIGAAVLVRENARSHLPRGGHGGSFDDHHGHDAGSAVFSGDNSAGSNDGGGWDGDGSDGGGGGGGTDGGSG